MRKKKNNSTTKKGSPKKSKKTLEQLITELSERDSKVREFFKRAERILYKGSSGKL